MERGKEEKRGREKWAKKQYGQSGDTDHPIFIDEITVIMYLLIHCQFLLVT